MRLRRQILLRTSPSVARENAPTLKSSRFAVAASARATFSLTFCSRRYITTTQSSLGECWIMFQRNTIQAEETEEATTHPVEKLYNVQLIFAFTSIVDYN